MDSDCAQVIKFSNSLKQDFSRVMLVLQELDRTNFIKPNAEVLCGECKTGVNCKQFKYVVNRIHTKIFNLADKKLALVKRLFQLIFLLDSVIDKLLENCNDS